MHQDEPNFEILDEPQFFEPMSEEPDQQPAQVSEQTPEPLPSEAPPTSAELLPILLQISEQQAIISNQLAVLLDTLTKPAETSMLDELRELLEPLLLGVQEIKGRLPENSAPPSSQPQDGATPPA
jgi:hypothetical protein